MNARPLIFAALLAACDVSTPIRFRPDGGSGACPLILKGDRAPFVDNSCAARPCRASAIESGCAVSIALEDCELTELRGIVLDDGTVEVELEGETAACTAAEKAPGAHFSTSCERNTQICRFDVYPAQNMAFAQPRELKLLNSIEFMFPPGNDREELGSPFALLRGYFGGSTRVDGGLVITTFDGRFDGIDCTSDAPTRTFFVSLPDFVPRQEWVTPPCLTRVVSGARGDFIGVFGGAQPMLGRFLLDGTLTSSRAIAAIGGASLVSQIIADHDDRRLYVLWTSSEVADGAGVLTLHDLWTLERLQISNPIRSHAISVDFTREGELAVSSRFDRRVEFFNADDAQQRGGFYLSTVRGLSDQPGTVALHQISGLLLIATTGMRPGVLVLDPARENPIVGSALEYESGGSIGALDLYRGALDWMIAGITDAPPMYRARAVRFDPVNARFVPGSVELGRGAVSRIFPIDDTEDMVAVLPWSATLVRLSVD